MNDKSNNRDTFDNRVNPLYQPLSINDSERRTTTYTPFEVIDAQMIVDNNGHILKSNNRISMGEATYMNDMSNTITDNPKVFAKLSSDNIHRRLINGSYIDGERIKRIDKEAIDLSRPDADFQSKIVANNTIMGNIVDEVAIDPSRICVQPSFNSQLPTYEIGTGKIEQTDISQPYKIQDYQSIYDSPTSTGGYKIEEYKSIYE